MKRRFSVKALVISSACAVITLIAWLDLRRPDESTIIFEPREFHTIDEPKPKARTAFLASERPILFIGGPGVAGREIFVNMTFNGQGNNVSPPQQVGDDGTWFSLGHGDLIGGEYQATLYVSGEPRAWTSFRVIK